MDITGVGSCAGSDVYSAQRVQAAQRPAGDLEGMIQRLIQDKDEDGNGTLNALEVCISDEAFKKIDANHDGELDGKELTNAVKQIGGETKRPGRIPRLGSDDDDDDDQEEQDAQMQALLDLLRQNDDEATATSIDTLF